MICHFTLAARYSRRIYFFPAASLRAVFRRNSGRLLDQRVHVYTWANTARCCTSTYLVVTFGHGFRYGKPYLYNSCTQRAWVSPSS